jgi:ABC-type bacteriocin/lantibiotic exporter with double-glycine peptidase domain
VCGQRLGCLLAAVILLKVPFFPDRTDQCGPATLASLLSFWGKAATPQQLRGELYVAKLHGTLPMDLVLTAESHGLKTEMTRGDLAVLRTELEAGYPVVAMLNRGFTSVPLDHYVIVTGIDDDRKGLFMHSAGKKNQFIPYKKFEGQWKKADFWAMLARVP